MRVRNVILGLAVMVGVGMIIREAMRPEPAITSPAVVRAEQCEERWGRDTEESLLCIRRNYCRDLWGPEAASANRRLYRNCVDNPISIAEAAETCRQYSDDPNMCNFDEPFYDPPAGYP
jgi:hypothetical protein